jgi:hypothetical protein
MTNDDPKYNQVNNIIRRSQALILNIKLLGADTNHAKDLLSSAREALEGGDYDQAIDYAKKSMVEVMELKKQIKSGEKPKPPKEKGEKPAPAKAPAKQPAAETRAGQKDSEIKSVDFYENGFSYLIEENRPDFCFNIFARLAENSKKNGLCICRINPAIIRRKYTFDESLSMLWLTDRESSKESTISPSLESMIYVAEEFIDKNEEAVILLDGIEYLISNNGFNPVLRFIRRLIDKISETNTILIIGVGSKSINEQELKLLEREMNPITIN